MSRHQRALRSTLLWAIVFCLPLGAYLYIRSGAPQQRETASLGSVKPFFFLLGENASFSNHNLRQSVSLIALVPPREGAELSSAELAKLEQIASWAKDTLTDKDKSVTPYQLFLLSPNGQTCSGWQSVAVRETGELQPFLPDGASLQGPTLVLIDQEAEIRSVFPLDENSFHELKTNWQRLSFNRYLFDYLSKRTFFGPKRSG